MVDAIVGLAIMQLFAAEEWLRKEISNVVGVEKDVKNLSSKLQSIRNVLDDAENRSIKDKSIQAWLEKLEDISYEMEDVLDEWNTAVLRRRIEEHDEGHKLNNKRSSKGFAPKKKMSFSSSSSLGLFSNVFPSKKVGVFRVSRDTALKIKALNKRLEAIIREKNDFNFVPNQANTIISSHGVINDDGFSQTNRISTSFVNISQVYGRMSDKKFVLSKFVSGTNDDRVRIHSIVGLGGVGKTTLAQLVYNDEVVEKSFSIKIWVYVSNCFDQVKIGNEIVEAIEGKSPNLSSLELLLQRIKRSIYQEKFLLVLDDLWNDDEKKWEPLRNCLEFGAPGSVILATTRNEKVARLLGADTDRLHFLDQLSDADCWSLFSQIAFVGRNEQGYDKQLERIGREIVKKCKGLPLAVRALGSLLRFKRSIEEWQNVLESEMWKLEVANVELFPHMYLSYKDLDPVTKRCFSYCSLYPKGHRMYAVDIIRFWMVQGFLTVSSPSTNSLSSSNNNIELETKGYDCLENLVMRSFFQSIELGEDGNIYSLKMHDIVHDFAQYVSRHECFIIDNVDSKSKYSSSPGDLKVRHLTWFLPVKDINPSSVCDLSELRTLFTISVPIDRLQTTELISGLKRVRTLIICNSGMEVVTKEIGRLIHLRYLCLRSNPLRELPESVGDLTNLQILDVKDCRNLSFLPESIGKLIKLTHLIVDFSSPKFPQSIQHLKLLRTLKRIVIGTGFNNLGCLKNLNQLRGELQIVFEGELDAVNWDDAQDHQAMNNAELGNKEYLKTFHLDFNGFKVSEDVIEALTPPPNIENLEIRYFPGKYFPGWMSNALNFLKVLELNECEYASCLPPLGELPSLETLYIGRIQSLRKVGRDFLRRRGSSVVAFPKLINLTFFACEEWEEWEDIGSEGEQEFIVTMPRLKMLEVVYCPKLKKLPHQLLRNAVSLEHLGIYECGLFEKEDEEDSIKVLLTHIEEVEINYKRYTRDL